MYASVRQYTGLGPGFFEELDRKHGEMEALVKSFPGLVNWYLIRTADGVATVTICQDQAGADASVRLAVDWVKANMSSMPQPPQVSNGEVLAHVAG
jgi:hypothetical protein